MLQSERQALLLVLECAMSSSSPVSQTQCVLHTKCQAGNSHPINKHCNGPSIEGNKQAFTVQRLESNLVKSWPQKSMSMCCSSPQAGDMLSDNGMGETETGSRELLGSLVPRTDLPNEPCRIATHHTPWLDIFRNNSPGGDYTALSYRYSACTVMPC